MNILFVLPLAYSPAYQEGVASISAVLKQKGHTLSLCIITEFDNTAKYALCARILSFKPGLVLIYSMTTQLEKTRQIAGYISGEFDLPVILGGIHPTVAPQESLRMRGVLGVCIGEGEQPVLEFTESRNKRAGPTGIKNMWFKKDGKIIKNEVRPLAHDLDTLPLPDRDLFSPYIRKHLNTNMIFFLAGRGCIYDCKYCGFNAWHKVYRHDKGKRVRQKSVSRVIAEIKSTFKKFGKTGLVLFEDPIFTLDEAWLREFCGRYKSEVRLPFVCTGHPRHINENIVRMLKKAGCINMPIAIESGNDFIRKEILGKHVERIEILDSLKLLKRHKIKTNCWILLGAPYETEKTIKDTIKFVKRVDPDSIFTSIFRPFPGTELYALCKDKGWISNRTVQSINDPEYVLDQPSISREKVIWYYTNYFHFSRARTAAYPPR